MHFSDFENLSPMEGMLGQKYAIMKIGNRKVGEGQPIYFIAEIGLNHNGDIRKAIHLIDIAADAGVDAVKFQKRALNSTYQKRLIEDPNLFEEGFRYLIPILQECELTRKDFDILYEHAMKRKVDFLCTAFDEESVDFLMPYDMPAFKVASADMTNLILLEKLVGTRKPLIISTGMATLNEIDIVGQYLRAWEVTCALLHCVSAYPTPMKDMHLSFMKVLRDRYGVPVGFSSHEVGIDVSVAAAACGANIIERHITEDKRQKGPDHPSSLEPTELKELMHQIRNIEQAKGTPLKELSHAVLLTKETLSKSLVATWDIKAGEPITRSMVMAKGPGKGLSPLYLNKLLGKRAIRNIAKDDFFLLKDCEKVAETHITPRFFSIWGFKGRFRDLDQLNHLYSPRFVEVHLNDKDIDYPFEQFHANRRYPFEIFLHYPTYWKRSVVNLASENEEERRTHIGVIQRVIDLARRIAPFFDGNAHVVVHLGGMDIYEIKDNRRLIDLAYDSLGQLNWDGIMFHPENNPPRPWYFSGQWYDNAFCAAEEMVDVCREFNLRMCLDLSHAKLYTNLNNKNFDEYIQLAAPWTSHLHIADAYGIDGEGVQIGDGEIDFQKAFELVKRYGKLEEMSWTPEIWQGHNDNNLGFLIGFERLSKIAALKPDITVFP